MLKKFFGRTPSRGSAPAVPPGQRVYAIGDVHGRLDLLDDLLRQIEIDDVSRAPAETLIIVLGDLIDRGPASFQVIERLRERKAGGAPLRFLLGNHEEIFLSTLEGDRQSLRLFNRIGGRETVLSYGLSEEAYGQADFEDLDRWLVEHVPVSHREFLARFEDLIVIGDYAFAHAGVNPSRSLEEQHVRDLRWIRGSFLDHRGRLEKVVVHGHTVSEEVEFRAHRIGIDTGAFASGKLTALGLEGEDQWLLQTIPADTPESVAC